MEEVHVEGAGMQPHMREACMIHRLNVRSAESEPGTKADIASHEEAACCCRLPLWGCRPQGLLLDNGSRRKSFKL